MFEKICLTESEAIQDIKILSELQKSICENGKIMSISNSKDDWEGVTVCKQDETRTAGLFELMSKYSYGWYITDSKSEIAQIKDLHQFCDYIISNIGKNVCNKKDF
jgi:hypothetical protein